MGALISAHRGGVGHDSARQNTMAAFERAIDLGCEFVEFDVRMTSDGHAVVCHDARLVHEDGPWVVAERTFADATALGLHHLDDVLTLIAGRVGAHVDLKVPVGEVEVTAQIVEALGTESVVVTTAEDESIPRLRAWAEQHAPDLRLGLSTAAREFDGQRLPRWVALVCSWFPRTRMRRSGADVVVARHGVARWWLRAWARRRGLLLLVWTVDSDRHLERWVNDPDTWLVTTNHPERAFELRRD